MQGIPGQRLDKEGVVLCLDSGESVENCFFPLSNVCNKISFVYVKATVRPSGSAVNEASTVQ